MNYRRAITTGVLVCAIGLMVLSSSASGAAATVTTNASAKVHASSVAYCNSIQFAYYGTTYSNSSYWGCQLKATDWAGTALPLNGWALGIYEVYCYSACNSAIWINDSGWYGDYYSLWVTTNSSLTTGWGEVGTTPQVATGSELVAPTYNGHWSGKGTKYSEGMFVVYDPAYTIEYFAIHDNLQSKMTASLDHPCGVSASKLLSAGCSKTGITVSAGWAPAGFTVAFGGYP